MFAISSLRRRSLLGATSALVSGAVATFIVPAAGLAQTATPLPPIAVDTDHNSGYCPLDSATVEGRSLAAKRFATSDTTSLLDGTPGMSAATGGGVSGLPVIHGMADDRNKVTVDGMSITSACPNHMNPATSYIDPSRVGKLDVVAGITPVSKGGDSIGGAISVESAPPVFAAPGEKLHTDGSVSTFFRSNNRAIGGSLSGDVATETYSLGYSGSAVRARDYHDGNGDRIATSQYAAANHAGTFAVRNGDTTITVQGGQQFIPYEGFPNQPMDLTGNHGRFLNTRYQGEFGWGSLDGRVYWQNVKHEMDFLSEKLSFMGGVAMQMPMNTDGTDRGYALKAELPISKRDTLRLGQELHQFRLNDWWPATSSAANSAMSPNTFININGGSRDVLGTFAEWEAQWTSQWTTLLGARNDTVWMNTGNVAGYNGFNVTPGMMGTTTNYGRDAAAFNAQDHAKTDVNLDLTALTRYERSSTSTAEIGFARKTRSPNLYERYSWSTGSMASSMTNWFGDGNGYIGNLNLRPETANTLSTSLAWHDAAQQDWEVKFTPYYTYVQDYIGVDKTESFTSGGGTFNTLTFTNHDAQLYGLDISGKTSLWNSPSIGQGVLKGSIGWLRGEQINNGNSLYHMMPLNARATLEHSLSGWMNAVDLQLVKATSQTDPLRKQPSTPGYALVNLRTGYQWDAVQVNLGIDNLFNRQYDLPLGGLDIGDWKQNNRAGAPGALAGPGRSVNAGMTVTF